MTQPAARSARRTETSIESHATHGRGLHDGHVSQPVTPNAFSNPKQKTNQMPKAIDLPMTSTKALTLWQ